VLPHASVNVRIRHERLRTAIPASELTHRPALCAPPDVAAYVLEEAQEALSRDRQGPFIDEPCAPAVDLLYRMSGRVTPQARHADDPPRIATIEKRELRPPP